MPGDAPSARLRAARDLRGLLRGGGARPAGPGLAVAALAELHGLLPYDCAALSRWDPLERVHRAVAVVGYPADVLGFLDRRMHTDPLFDEVRRGRVPVRVRDIPRPRRRGDVFDLVIDPLGFRDGVTQCLFAADGRYLGMLNASTLDLRHPDDDAVALLDLLADDVAGLLDPLPAAGSTTAALATGAAEGLFVTATALVPLSPGARPELAGPRSPLRPLVSAALAGGGRVTSVLALVGHELLEVTLEPRPGGVVLLHRPAAPPFGLTPRELEVLAALSRGGTNPGIARDLRISPRTVATHVEHLLAKTGAPNRTAAARLAADLGLVV
ncbi:MAG TPA: LuxR C-terminal-related transcriptional regulator [Pseudonocardia sp.]|nr:LuxR C-terminal-related transcriptional regulator [Pseudonocardia sp.]